MGIALLGGNVAHKFGQGLEQGNLHRLGNLAGFMAVVRTEFSGVMSLPFVVMSESTLEMWNGLQF